ncbi:unnamed protein product [Rotaria sp. Silwood2]|nr:unnamed protein product [Rotaria sp. Silwood2]CAF2551445.1 unnamed protein product [Rotaria sp. Silwood2]CAF2959348.1 unnamed protein product [Rotaria sp. Silwood2]CAF4151955.1 unnamed protein product [Rotaria sp. Silwood2]CAF4361908.1 unnamed protein product [Rotaria sp. Silwood2]
MLSRAHIIRRTVYGSCTTLIFIYIVFGVYRYYYQGYFEFYDSTDPIKPYNKYTTIHGGLIPVSGYKILQSVANPSLQRIHDLYTYLNENKELKDYFILVPEDSYHITLTRLTNTLSIKESQLQKLEEEQELLDKNNPYIKCVGKKLLLIEKNEIRLQIELNNKYIDGYIKNLQKRWNNNFPKLITKHCTSFYIPLAYQYKDIPNQDILNRFNEALQQWYEMPIDVQLDPIEICSYSNLFAYEPILADYGEDD